MTDDQTAADRPLDAICMGRAGVDLYGEQVGGRLEDMASFAKYVGGSPTNTAIAGARLGLKTAALTRVGDEHMGRFIRETLAAEGVDTSHVATDPERLTALVILGIRDRETFPLIFYRENCADMALSPDDVDPAWIATAKALVVSGTHFSTPGVDAASRAAMAAAKAAGTRVALDIDYRPVLWGLTGHGLGEERFVADRGVTAHLQTIVPDCDLIVGTEEEIHIAGGSTETVEALRTLRRLTDAVIVLKRGPMGCVVFDGPIPEAVDDGIAGPGFPVEVFNVLGAGDGFMGGLLRGWLREEPWPRAAAFANACGAFAVSRHGCAPSYPSWTELAHFLEHGSETRALRKDAGLERLHWATTRARDWPEVCAFAFDHRAQLEALASRHGRGAEAISAFKELAVQAVERLVAARGAAGLGLLCDGRFGRPALDRATGSGVWIGRPIEWPGSRPLTFEGGPSLATTLREWPVEHCVKCLVFHHPDDPDDLRAAQEARLVELHAAARATRHELLIEVIPPKDGPPVGDDTVARSIERLYALGVAPDWWKLQPPPSAAAWTAIDAAIRSADPHCRGILLLGLEAPEAELANAFADAAAQPLCKGFAVGRSIFQPAADAWFGGTMGDDAAVADMAERYRRLIDLWRDRRAKAA